MQSDEFSGRERSFFLLYGELNRSRVLKRGIQKEILDPLRLDILEGKFYEGQTIRVDAKNGAVEKKKGAEEEKAINAVARRSQRRS
jgi:hypothetical protein